MPAWQSARVLGEKAGQKTAHHSPVLRASQEGVQGEMGNCWDWHDLVMTLKEFIQKAEGLTCQVMSGSQYGY